jgi:hypothetical protein
MSVVTFLCIALSADTHHFTLLRLWVNDEGTGFHKTEEQAV